MDRQVLGDLLDLSKSKHLHLAPDFIEQKRKAIRLFPAEPSDERAGAPNQRAIGQSSSASSSSARPVVVKSLGLKPRREELSIDWAGFDEREQRYLAKEQRRLGQSQLAQRYQQMECDLRQQHLLVNKQFLLSFQPDK